VLLAVRVLPSAIVSVALVAGAVKATLLMLVALATPRVGVVSEGLLLKTSVPDPDSSVIAVARLALDGVASHAATPVPSPLIPVDTGSPVQFVSTPLAGVPRAGVTSVGLVAKTAAPLPVSSVSIVAS
jgi:hypothetical protein